MHPPPNLPTNVRSTKKYIIGYQNTGTHRCWNVPYNITMELIKTYYKVNTNVIMYVIKVLTVLENFCQRIKID